MVYWIREMLCQKVSCRAGLTRATILCCPHNKHGETGFQVTMSLRGGRKPAVAISSGIDRQLSVYRNIENPRCTMLTGKPHHMAQEIATGLAALAMTGRGDVAKRQAPGGACRFVKINYGCQLGSLL